MAAPRSSTLSSTTAPAVYHERSKHHLERYAPGPGGLDWATQPDPFRRFEGSPWLELPLLATDVPIGWDALFAPTGLPAQAMNAGTVAQLFELSLGLSAWKSHGGNRWALRCNPSSGNLHPTEGYLVCPALPGLPAGVHHYRPDLHGLEHRAAAPLRLEGGILLALSGIHWREAWKYGMRAFRYCQHDAGHALAALAYSAALLGWPLRQLSDWGDEAVARLCGLDRAADFPGGLDETPELLVWIGPGAPPAPAALLATLADAAWSGVANRLSPTQRDWPDIAAVAAATLRPAQWRPTEAVDRAREALVVEANQATRELNSNPTGHSTRSAAIEATADLASHPAGAAASKPESIARRGSPPERPGHGLRPSGATVPASLLIRRRRSAQAFDGRTEISAPHFLRLLDALLPRPGLPPWSALKTVPAVHPVIFVHRVSGLEPGIYCLPRSPEALDELRAAMRPDWLWDRVETIDQHSVNSGSQASTQGGVKNAVGLPLYLLAPIDVRDFAATASCHQDIASDSAFMVVMLARFDDLDDTPWRYRERFAEAGMLGQVLYLEAEAGNLQGTGIGCYFDDVVHRALGVDTTRFQDVYQFTVGRAVLDTRLGSEAGYAALAGTRQSIEPSRET